MLLPFDIIEQYPPGEGYLMRVRVTKEAAGYRGDGFIQHKEDREPVAISIMVPIDTYPVGTIDDAKRPWIELARSCGYDLVWSDDRLDLG